MTYRIGAVSFLNTVPLIEWFLSEPRADIELIRDLPSRLGARLGTGQADVALLPVVEIFRGVSEGIISHTGIACRGPVASVKLFVRGEVGAVRRVHADRGSRSSVALLQILLLERYGLDPAFGEYEPRPDRLPDAGEALLIIGDRCLAYEAALGEHDVRDVQALDLGELWYETTGLPFVFAAWAVAPGFVARAGAEGVERLAAMLDTARDFGLDRLEIIAEREAQNGRLGCHGESTAAAILSYFRHALRFELGARETAGLRRFHELCSKHGLCPPGPLPEFLRG